jgi:hypothetical protein
MEITQEPAPSDLRITLRVDRFVLATNLLGWTTNPLRAQNIGVDSITIRRALKGQPVGERFITCTVAALEPHRELLERIGVIPDLNGLFEITARVAP